MSATTIFVCDLCGGNEGSNTIYGIWTRPMKVNFDSKPTLDNDKHLCQCCLNGIVSEFNKHEEGK